MNGVLLYVYLGYYNSNQHFALKRILIVFRLYKHPSSEGRSQTDGPTGFPRVLLKKYPMRFRISSCGSKEPHPTHKGYIQKERPTWTRVVLYCFNRNILFFKDKPRQKAVRRRIVPRVSPGSCSKRIPCGSGSVPAVARNYTRRTRATYKKNVLPGQGYP